MSEISQFLINHGLLVIFLIVFLEQMGLPLPALPWLLAAGALASSGKFNPFLGIGLAVLACVLADTFWFYLGRYRGVQVLGLLCRISLEPDSCVRRTQNVFTRYGLKGLAVSKFVPGLNTVAPPLAGMAGISLPRFLLADGTGSLLYGASFIGFGYFFSGQIQQIGAAITQIGSSALTLLLALLALYIAGKFWQRQRLLRELRAARITVAELLQKVEAGENPVILDLRSSAELSLSPSLIRGAIHVDADEIARRSHEIPRDRDIVVYCSCPNEVTSARVARLLQRQGFTRIRPLLGGIEAWRKSDYPMEAWSSTVAIIAPAIGTVDPQKDHAKRPT
ncbi:MAG: DedA family protein/thiosulfate sulfurtransferase GlpE [Verrucomicrobiota bacterium]|jgi:membrane protein DedA with SNARE-associated domain/rhodanese-related sulfurtransferase